MILIQFKDIAKQSRSVKEVIDAFQEYQEELKTNNVESTELKDKYTVVMYAAVMRTFARILRREHNPERKKMLDFVGA